MLYKDFLNTIKVCPFCNPDRRIISENKRAYLTLSIAPYHEYHMLVLPRRHVLSILDLSLDEWNDVRALIQVGARILEQVGFKNYTALVRNGDASGRSIEHLHFHIVPAARLGDTDHVGQERRVLTGVEQDLIYTRLREFLNQTQ